MNSIQWLQGDIKGRLPGFPNLFLKFFCSIFAVVKSCDPDSLKQCKSSVSPVCYGQYGVHSKDEDKSDWGPKDLGSYLVEHGNPRVGGEPEGQAQHGNSHPFHELRHPLERERVAAGFKNKAYAHRRRVLGHLDAAHA